MFLNTTVTLKKGEFQSCQSQSVLHRVAAARNACKGKFMAPSWIPSSGDPFLSPVAFPCHCPCCYCYYCFSNSVGSHTFVWSSTNLVGMQQRSYPCSATGITKIPLNYQYWGAEICSGSTLSRITWITPILEPGYTGLYYNAWGDLMFWGFKVGYWMCPRLLNYLSGCVHKYI